MVLFVSVGLQAQNIDPLVFEAYQKQQALLLKSEIRKVLGDKANRPEFKEDTKILLPWAMMEEMSPKDFARAVLFVSKAREMGIPFEMVEDLLPSLRGAKVKSDEYPYLIMAISEAEKASLATDLRDMIFNGAFQRNYDGLSTLTAVRFVILARAKKVYTESTVPLLWKHLTEQSLSTNDIAFEKNLRSLETKLGLNLSRQERETFLLSLNSYKQLAKSLPSQDWTAKQRNIDETLADYSVLELRERPRLNWTAEDLGIVETPSPNQTKDWRDLSVSRLKQIVSTWIGTKYVYGGTSKSGTDCSGFTRSVLVDRGIDVPIRLIPRGARDQSQIGSSISRAQIGPGDLVFFSASPNTSKITHVGLALGNEQFAHASSTRGVVIQSLEEKWWKTRLQVSRRIFLKTVQ
ncbi:NlpC/P60 family protein [Leptospira ryugenii]|uniref:NlpC/P60 family protein n=2 Tax=Leptospira ryugenii TaxID=1917863 RepID=A0A2P2DXI4_9LEPT|nr:NlpC/P60 family protein [Leptospira ryugenii]